MRWKRVFIFAVLLLFLAVQAVPLMATDKVGGGTPTIAVPNHDDGGGDGGEEHPWQDDDGDNNGTAGFSKHIDWLIGLFFDIKIVKKVEKDNDQRKARKPYKKFVAPEKRDKK
jgi:hypothetical protein